MPARWRTQEHFLLRVTLAILGLSIVLGLPAGALWKAFRPEPESAADGALDKSMAAMHSKMEQVRRSGDPDADFALMMIPHHQGAVDMAKVELQFGKDLRLRRLAQEIIVTQQSEIEVMKGALKAYDVSANNRPRPDWCTR